MNLFVTTTYLIFMSIPFNSHNDFIFRSSCYPHFSLSWHVSTENEPKSSCWCAFRWTKAWNPRLDPWFIMTWSVKQLHQKPFVSLNVDAWCVVSLLSENLDSARENPPTTTTYCKPWTRDVVINQSDGILLDVSWLPSFDGGWRMVLHCVVLALGASLAKIETKRVAKWKIIKHFQDQLV